MPRISGNLQVILVLLALLALSIASALLKTSSHNPEVIVNPSIYNTAPSGVRAWYLAAQKAHLPMQSWEKPFSDLEEIPEPAVMLMVQPFTAAHAQITYGHSESDQLLRWVARGNTLVLLDDFRRLGSRALIHEVSIPIHATRTSPKHIERLLTTGDNPAITQFVANSPQTHTCSFFQTPNNGKITVLLRDSQEHPVLIKMPYRKGTLILGTPTDLVENQWLHRHADSNFQLLTNLLRSENKPVFINEFVHGYNQVEDIFAFFREKTPVGAIFMQFIFAFLLILWLSFTRWQPILRAETDKQENGLQPFINSLASIYYRRHAASLAIKPQVQKIAAILRRRYQVDLSQQTNQAQLQNLLETLPKPYSSNEAQNVLSTLRQAQELATPNEAGSATLPHRELHQLSKTLSELQERLQHAKR